MSHVITCDLQMAKCQRKHDLPRKAEGDTVPLLRETMTLMPVSTKGTENSTTSDRSSFMVREPMAMSALLDTTCQTRQCWSYLSLCDSGLNKASLKPNFYRVGEQILFASVFHCCYCPPSTKLNLCELLTVLQSTALRQGCKWGAQRVPSSPQQWCCVWRKAVLRSSSELLWHL